MCNRCLFVIKDDASKQIAAYFYLEWLCLLWIVQLESLIRQTLHTTIGFLFTQPSASTP